MRIWLYTLIVFLAAVSSFGGIVAPLYVGNIDKALDQTKRPFIGDFGYPQNSSRIEIRLAVDGVIRPPDTNGMAHYKNPMVDSNSVCRMGLNALGGNSGLFCMIYPLRIPEGSKVFARVFNSPLVETATFYADSSLVVAPPAYESSLVLKFNDACPIKAGDADGDGLNDSWEQYLGIDDRLTSDYDGDGMGDLAEMLSGTAPDDPSSIFKIKYILRLLDDVSICWYSVPNKRYQLQGTYDLMSPFTNIGDIIVATGYETTNTQMETNVAKQFRIMIPQQ